MLYRCMLYFFILDRKLSFASKPQVSSDRLQWQFAPILKGNTGQKDDKEKNCGGRPFEKNKNTLRNTFLMELYFLTIAISCCIWLLVLHQCVYCTETILRGYSVLDLSRQLLIFRTSLAWGWHTRTISKLVWLRSEMFTQYWCMLGG